MTSSTTRVGFIGAGGIAGRHLEALTGFDDVAVVAVAATSLERAGKLAGRAGARPYADFEAMLEKERLDALYICVPPFAHGAIERVALERDLPFFVEKPLAADLESALAIAGGVLERGLVTSVGYQLRYLDTTERARELLADHPARLALGYWLDATPPPTWWRQEALSGGQMVEQTTHIFDLARDLVGEVAAVSALGSRTARPAFPDADVLDVSTASLRFESGAVGSMASTCLLNRFHTSGLHLFCEGMTVELSARELVVDVGQGRPVERSAVNPYALQARAFIDAVQGKDSRIRSPYADAIRTHRLTLAAAQSARENGQQIELGGA